MARTVDILGIQLDLKGFDAAALRTLDSLGQRTAQGFRTEMGKAVGQTAAAVTSSIQEAIATGVANGTKNVQDLEKKFAKAALPFLRSIEEAKKLEEQLSQTTDQNIKDQLELRLRNLRVYQTQHSAMLDIGLKAEMTRMTAAHDKRMKLAQEWADYSTQDFSDKFEQAVEGLGDTLNDIVTLNLKDAFKKGGGFFNKMGAGLQAGGAAKGGGMGEAMKGIGGLVGKLGPMLVAVGAVAGGMALLVKVIMDAEAQTRELNREIINSAGALDTMGTKGKDVIDGLDSIRKAAIDATNPLAKIKEGVVATKQQTEAVMKLGVATKDYINLLNKFAEAGVTFDRMRGSAQSLAEETENYTKYVKTASVYSRLVGENMETMATNMSEYMTEFGMSLQEVSNGFATITDEAQKSGYGTKRFFNMVLQATTGMGMYNVRLDSTAKLLSKLAKTLGMTKAGEFLKEMTGKITGESYKDRTKRILTTGKDFTMKIIGKDAEMQAGTFQKAFGKLKLDPTTMTEGAAEFAKTVSTASSKDLAQSMSKLSSEDRRSFLQELAKEDPDLAKRAEGTFKLTQGLTGNMKDMTEAIGYLGSGSKMVMEMNKLRQVTGKSLSEMTLQEKMAYQEQTGTSTDMMDQMQRVQENSQRQFEEAKRIQDAVKNQTMSVTEANEKLKESNLMLNKDGKLQSITSDTVIKDANDQMMNLAEVSADEEEKLANQQMQIGEATNQAIYDLNDLVQNSMIGILETISGHVSDILVWLGLKEDKSGMKTAILKQEEEVNQKKQQLNDEIKQEQDKIKQLQAQLTSGKLTESQAEMASQGIQAGKQIIASKRAEQTEMTQGLRASKRLGTMGSDEQFQLFQKLAGTKGTSEALRVVGGMSSSEAAEALKGIESKKAAAGSAAARSAFEESGYGDMMGGGAAAAGASFASQGRAKEEAEKMAIEELAASKKQTSQTDKIQKDTADNKKFLDETVKALDAIKKQGEEEERRKDVEALNLAMKKAGFSEEQMLIPGGDSASISQSLGALATGSPELYAKFQQYAPKGVGKKYGVKDAVITEKGDVIQGAPGDITFLADKAGLTGLGNSGGNGANFSIVIHATAGMEHVVQTQVLSALKQYYGVVTGSTRSYT